MKNSVSADHQSKAVHEIDEVQLADIIKVDNKVNVYFFWENGCPHCAAEFVFFKRIKEEYGTYFQLYAFETWEHPKNAELLTAFADAMVNRLSVYRIPLSVIRYFRAFRQAMKKRWRMQ